MTGRGHRERIVCGYIPLADASSLMVARDLGFAAEEGVDLELVRETSWSNIRDKIALGMFDAAHMLAPMPVAMSMGLSAHSTPIIAPMLLSVNGNMIGVSPSIAARLRAATGSAFFNDAQAAAAALKQAAAGRPLRIGVPWLFSMHACLLDYWLGRSGFALDRDVTLTVVPPPYMVEALSAGEIDMFCVGEPWGSMAVEEEAGDLLLSASAIWRFAPEKALGVGPELTNDRPDTLAALLRAVYRAAEWASRPEHSSALAEMLARPDRLDRPAEVIERAFTGRLVVDKGGEIKRAPRPLELFAGCATFPWRSQELWIANQLAMRHRLDEAASIERLACFRPDLYRQALSPIGAALPTASAKLEGALADSTPSPATIGEVDLGPDRFFDGAVFDPETPTLPKN